MPNQAVLELAEGELCCHGSVTTIAIELSLVSSVVSDPRKDPSSTGRQLLCSPCFLFLVCSSFSKKLYLSSILASSPKSKRVLLAAGNFPQSLPPFEKVQRGLMRIYAGIPNLLLPLLAKQQETAKDATSLLGCGDTMPPRIES